jgi:hypothetical protein
MQPTAISPEAASPRLSIHPSTLRGLQESVSSLDSAIKHALAARRLLLRDIRSCNGGHSQEDAILRALQQHGTMRIGRLQAILEIQEGLRIPRATVKTLLDALQATGRVAVDPKVGWIRAIPGAGSLAD